MASFLKRILKTVIEATRRYGMAVTAYCPLCRGSDLFDSNEVSSIAGKHGRTPAQIILRWHMQQDGVAAIPRSQTPSRIAENLDVFGFELDEDDMEEIGGLRRRNIRICDFNFSPGWDPVAAD